MKEIEAGEDFSLGLASFGGILAAGRDDTGQVTGPRAAAADYYIQIAAGKNTAVALDRDGYIKVWGQELTGTAAPADKGYTDISLGDSYALALKESANEQHITGPLSPETTLLADDGSSIKIPLGSTFEHTRNGVTRVFDTKGTELFWVNDDESPQVRLPDDSTFASSVIHYGPVADSAIFTPENHSATWAGPGVNGVVVLNVSEDKWYDEQAPDQNQTLPVALCSAYEGCNPGATSRNQLFLNKPRTTANGDIPVFSVSVSPLCDYMWIGTLGVLGSTNAEDSQTVYVQKKRVDPDQPIRFYLVNSTSGPAKATDLYVTAQATLTSENAVLQYSGVATGSKDLSTSLNFPL
jgi:hypothetical protein